jgi:hypothetical protein
MLIFFICFRGFVTADSLGYYDYYKTVPTFSDGILAVAKYLNSGLYENREKGYQIYTIICKTISSNYFFFQAISSLIDIVIIYYFFKIYLSNNRIILGFIFFFLFGLAIEFGTLRNVKATMLFMISIMYINKQKILPFIGINILGVLFHSSAVLYLPLYYFLNKRPSKKIILLIFIVGNFIYILQIKWMAELLIFISNRLHNFRIGYLLQVYMRAGHFSVPIGVTVGYFERTFSFILVYYFHNKLIKQSHKNIIFLNLIYMYWFIYLYFSEMLVFPDRVGALVVFVYWVIFPQIYELISRKKKIVFMLLLTLYGTMKLFQKSSIDIYDNVLIDYRSYDERKLISNSFMSELK